MMAMEPIAVLEVGTSRTRVFVGEDGPDGGLQVAGMAEVRSGGIQKGEVIHGEAAAQSIVRAVEDAQRALEMDINDVQLAVNGAGVEGLPHREEMAVEGAVDDDDVDRLAKQVPDNVAGAGRENVQSVAGQFLVDGLRVSEPQGMAARTLALDLLILHGQRPRLMNLIQTVKQAGLAVKSLQFGGVASAMAVTDAESRKNGVLVIDVGAGTTDYAAYANGQLVDGGALPVGGGHVTSDICRAFRVVQEEGEALKIEHGGAMVCATQRTQRLTLRSGGRVKTTDLQAVIHLRMEETFRLVRERLQRRNLTKYFGDGVVLTGGGAKLNGAATLAQEVFGLPCRVGVPLLAASAGERYAREEYATGLGGLACAYQREWQRQAHGETWLDKVRKFIGW